MRTTIDLDDDVIKAVSLRRAEEDTGLSVAVNDLIRQGLGTAATQEVFVQETTQMGRPLVPMDNVAEALDILEGEARR